MLKKVLKGLGIFLLVTIIALAAAPFLFKDKIKEMIAKTLNENVNANIAFEDVDLSLLKSFPKAHVTIDKLSIINKAPFEGDTLLYAGETNVTMSVKELFKGEREAMSLESFNAVDGIVNIFFNKDGIGNFDIAIKQAEETKPSESKPFSLDIQKYGVENLKFSYTDEGSNMKMVLDSIYHEGKGNFAAQKLDLETKTTAKLSFEMEKTNYMNNVGISLDAILGIDLEKSKYEFKDNKALINQLPLEFNGFIQMVEAGQTYDLTFKTPTSDFKNFLGLVPAAYSGDISKVKTTGQFSVDGKVKGNLTETTIPAFDVKIASNNASFQYPDLPKSVKNIVIDTHIINESGAINDTYVNLHQLSFAIDQDVFNAKAIVKNIATNAIVDAELKGTINLANVTKAYPVKLDKPLSGILKADVETIFDMQSVEKSQYQNIKNSGTVSLTGFHYEGPDMAKPFKINQANVAFNPNHINLSKFDAKTGSSDIQINGTLDNFYGFMFKNQILKGKFNMSSTKLVVSDFMAPTTTTTEEGKKTTEAVKIPSFLDCSITAKAGTVVYDNLNLKDVSGNMIIRDEAVTLNNLKMGIFGGNIGLTGTVSTKGKTPKFDMDLGLNSVNIAESFTQLDMLKSIAPIAGVINGKLNSTIKLSGNLQNDMTPNLKTISGDLFGQLLSTTINEKNSAMLTALSSNMKFIDLNKLNLNDVKAALSFKDGKVNVKPFDIKYQDITVNVGGSHGFDQTMNYNLKFDVPVKYLGKDVTNLLAKLTPADQKQITSIPVNGLMTGNFSQPKFNTDLKQATTNLTTQLVKMQKEKLVKQGSNALGNLLGGTKNNTTTDSTKTTSTPKEEIKNTVKDKATGALKDLFGRKKKEE
ncbi:AsmA-like C-terminal region-containing protein [Flavobacterium sp. HXWNR69]|uniref:AsmA-like C-terminal region-containing protein n=1 Tax=Flavobacterium fragile TaxID=2949085 RepID=A0ABT0TDB6_9FLAO|nr:AsmA-like C-terminal region-containing protein [Flavobacterium sp. HXWNR69]MCL9768959.1 AsmA-like C-terminal region-containing protein [Flavobacterium sp. HXWNR69]